MPCGLEWMQAAFAELSTSRGVSLGGPMPIPFHAIDAYAHRFEIDDFEEFLELIREMDEAYLHTLGEKK